MGFVMYRKIINVVMASALVAGVCAASVQPAEARRGSFAAGVAAGVIGLGLLGAYAHARDRVYYEGGCYRGPMRCEWTPGRCYYNDYGDRICRRGYERCYRPTYCD
jgi:hypothetical protein